MANRSQLEALRSEGALRARGEFSLDRDKAREKLQKYQLRDPHHYVLEFVQAAHLLGATVIRFDIDADEVEMSFDSTALTRDDLEDVYEAAFSSRLDRKTRALRHLAIGLTAAQAMDPALIRVEVVRGSTTTRMEIEDGFDETIDVFDLAERGEGTRIYLREKFRAGHLIEFFQNLRGELAEKVALREYCAQSPRPIFVGDERVSFGHELADGVHGQVPVETDHELGVIGIVPRGDTVEVTILQNGVKVVDHRMPAHLVAARAVIESDRLTKNLSQSAFVEDDAWQAFVEQVLPAALFRTIFAYVSDLDQAGIAAHRPWLRRLCTKLVPQAPNLDARSIEQTQRRYGLGDSLEALPRLIALLAGLPLWPIVEPEEGFASLAELAFDDDGQLRSEIRYTSAKPDDVSLGGDGPIALFSNDVPTLFQEQFGERLRDVTDDYAALVARRRNRASWRNRPWYETPPPSVYEHQLHFDGRRMRATLGLADEPEGPATLMLVKDGHLLVQKQLDILPVSGVVFYIGGDMPENRTFDGVEPDEEYIRLAIAMVGALADFVGEHADSVRRRDEAELNNFWARVSSGLLFGKLLQKFDLPAHVTIGARAEYIKAHPDCAWAGADGTLTLAPLAEPVRRPEPHPAPAADAQPETEPDAESPPERHAQQESDAPMRRAALAAFGDMLAADGPDDRDTVELTSGEFDVVSAPEPPASTPEQRLLQRLRALLAEVRGQSDYLLDDHLLDALSLDLDDDGLVARTDAGEVAINPTHPAARYALERPEDPVALAFLGSSVYSSVNIYYEEITESHESEFLARLLARLQARLGRRA